jgi:hypothetical protein
VIKEKGKMRVLECDAEGSDSEEEGKGGKKEKEKEKEVEKEQGKSMEKKKEVKSKKSNKKYVRRIDIKLVPAESFYYGMIIARCDVVDVHECWAHDTH